jgi:Fe2+ transport system protein FeoA
MEIESQLVRTHMGTSGKRMRRRWGLGRRRARRSLDTISTPGRAEENASRLTLPYAPAGIDLCVTSLDANGHTQRLRELGMFEGQRVRVLSAGNPMICQVGDCRFGLCRRLADCILVERLPQVSAQSA